ncbi:MAG: DJ-1/PfpI family protein [Coriobacteriia bacterium]|nr:DJ-1/PfpI family protein [Coriobacteriia bacterium]
MKTVLMVIAPDQFRDEEYTHPREVLEARGDVVVTASIAPGPCRGKLGMMARAEVAVAEADPAVYDAVIFVGGAGAQIYFDDPDAHRLARTMHENGKVVAAICIAPSVLARAGLLDGVRATAFSSQEDDLRAHGAIWIGDSVQVDGAIITGNGPAASRDFGMAVADVLGLP